MVLLALQWGGSKFPWDSAKIIGLFAGSVPIILIFLYWEHRRGDSAMIPLRLLGRRIVYCACITGMLQMGSSSVLALYLPTWFQLVKQKSPTDSGINILPTFISQIIASLVAGYSGT